MTTTITSLHALVYSDDPEATRAFLRDVLEWPYVEHTESGPGWLIFKSGPSEVGVHPTSGTHDGEKYSYPRHHSISLMCDDVDQTVAELTAKGVEFEGPVQDLGFGLGVTFDLLGAGGVFLYQPRHATAYDI
jgi:catechol 2,3-dioxygenase-like lactoylglutathione lyase family enzyme